MDLKKLPHDVLEDVRSRGFTDGEIEAMKSATVFNEFCIWHGLIGHGYGLWNTVIALQEAEKK